MALSDLFNTPFLISLGITLLLVGFLGMFLTQKMLEQNHKISSMLGLVSTMADEMNYMRARMQAIMNQNSDVIRKPLEPVQISGTIQLADPLIPVSDGEDDDDSDSDGDSDSDDKSESSESSNDSVDETESGNVLTNLIMEDNIIQIGDNDGPNIKVINMGETMNISYDTLNEESLGDGDNETIDSSTTGLESMEDEQSISESLTEIEPNGDDFKAQIKSISVQMDTTDIKKPTNTELKKMSIETLRTLATSKGFTGDVLKIKKAELFKIVKNLVK
jgi:hypothetical protein